jgi:EpsI family protein
MKNKTFLAVLIILIGAAFFSILSYRSTAFEAAGTARITEFPMRVGEWTAQDVRLDPRVYDLLETDNLIMRDYKNELGDVVNLYVIYSESNRKVSHPPEICLQGEGGTVVEKADVRISPGIMATQLILEKRDNQEAVLYWYKTGKSFTHEYFNQQVKASIDRIFGKRTSVALIRVITQIKEKNRDAACKQISAFSRQIEPLLQKYAP